MAKCKNGLYLHGAGVFRGKRGEKGQELIQMVIPLSGSGKLYAALCIGGYPQGDLQAAVVCPYVRVAEAERAASEPCRLILTSGYSLPSDWPQQSGHPWQSCPTSSCLQRQVTGGVQLPKGEVASSTGDGINNWDMSMGTPWDGKYGLWEPFWNSSQGLVGIPWGTSVARMSHDYGTERHTCGMCQQGEVERRD